MKEQISGQPLGQPLGAQTSAWDLVPSFPPCPSFFRVLTESQAEPGGRDKAKCPCMRPSGHDAALQGRQRWHRR